MSDDINVQGRVQEAIERVELLVKAGHYPAAVAAVAILSQLDRVAYEFGDDGAVIAGTALRAIELFLDILEQSVEARAH